MNKGASLAIDYTGAHGGQLAMAFAAGCVSCTAFWGVLGRWLYGIIGKAKDDRIAELTATIKDNEDRCAETNAALTLRVQQLETLLLVHGPGALRQDLQKVISERRVEEVIDNGA